MPLAEGGIEVMRLRARLRSEERNLTSKNLAAAEVMAELSWLRRASARFAPRGVWCLNFWTIEGSQLYSSRGE